MKIHRWLAIAAILCLGTGAGCGHQKGTAEQALTPVKVKAVEMSSPGTGLRYSASIEPKKQVEVAFKVGGYVEQVLQVRGVDGQLRDVQEGDLVARGTVLARLRTSDYEAKVNQARAQLAEAEAGLEPSRAQATEAEASLARGKLDFERAAKLLESQSLTKPDYDAAKAYLEMAQARANAAKAQIDVVNARTRTARAALADAEIPLDDTALRAPMDAVVLQATTEPGVLASPGRTEFVLADTTSVKAVFGVPDLALEKLKLGSVLTLTTEAVPGTEFRGQMTRISPAADRRSRVFDVEVTIPNPKQLLKVGMIASLSLTEAAPSAPSIVVPLSAIVRSKTHPDQYAVYVAEEKNGQCLASLRNVRLGKAFGSTIAVLEGLKIGERVITTGATLVENSQPVQVIP
jgi:multidrug efflux pump subunit AcrA (membrane-fusion protein)